MCTCVCTCAYRDVPSLHVALAAEGTASSNNIEIGCLNRGNTEAAIRD